MLGIGKRNQKRIKNTDQHGLRNAHLDERNPHIANNQNDNRDDRRKSLERIDADHVALGDFCFNLTSGTGFEVAKQQTHKRDADRRNSTANQCVVHVHGNRLKNVKIGHFGDIGVMR